MHSQVTIENIDAHIHESDLDRMIRQAVEQRNFSLAVRLYYLAIIKELSLSRAIRWRREKTNRDYLRELRHTPLFENFREATRIFERSWYGNKRLAEADFQMLQPRLQQLVAAAKKRLSPSTPAADG